MTKKQLTAALQLRRVSLYTISKDRKGGYNVTYARYLPNNCITTTQIGFIIAENYTQVAFKFNELIQNR